MLYLLGADVNAIFSWAQREILTVVMSMYANERARKDSLRMRNTFGISGSPC